MFKKTKQIAIFLGVVLGALPGLSVLGNWVVSLGPASNIVLNGTANYWQPYPPHIFGIDNYESEWDKRLKDNVEPPVTKRSGFYVANDIDWKIENTIDEANLYLEKDNLSEDRRKKVDEYIEFYKKILKSFDSVSNKSATLALKIVRGELIRSQIYHPEGFWSLELKNKGDVAEENINLKVPDALFAVLEFESGVKKYRAENEIARSVQLSTLQSGESVSILVWTKYAPSHTKISNVVLSSDRGRGTNNMSESVSGNALFFGKNWFWVLYWVVSSTLVVLIFLMFAKPKSKTNGD